MKRLLVLIVVLASLLTACGNPSNPYAAKVGDTVISTDEIEREMRVLAENADTAADLDANLESQGGLRPGGDNTISTGYATQVVSARILGALFDDEMARLGLGIDDAGRAAAEAQLRETQGAGIFDSFPQAYRDYTITRQAQLDALLRYRSSDAELRKFYEANAADFAETCLRYIVVTSPAEADDIRDQLVAGADFAAVANERSIDSPVRQGGQPNGGELGCLPEARISALPEPFRGAIQRAEQGEITEVINLQGAFFIAQPTVKRQVPFEEAREGVAQTYATPSQLFVDLASGADIEVNPRYGDYVEPTIQSLQGTALVVPHTPYALTPDPDASQQAPANDIFGGVVPQQ